MSSKRIVIIGAGPVGLEAALYAATLGHDVTVYEAGRVGEHMQRWGHVALFSPWSLNHSNLGERLLEELGAKLPQDDDYLTGGEHVEAYLRPLARSRLLAGRVRQQTRVVHVGRQSIGKSDLIGGRREAYPFRILIESSDGEELVAADVVIDCSGTYGNHNWLGSGNLPALGERKLEQRIAYTLRDVLGAERADYEGHRVLLVGDGQSAATALDGLTRLDGTEVIWVSRNDRERPYEVIEGDPLPERARQASLGNVLAAGADPRVQFRRATVVERVAEQGEGFAVTLRGGERTETVEVDRILAHVGYSPDNSIYRELQVHECYATMGPMKLASALLSESTLDCLAQTPKGPELMRNPEPGFFIIGAKSYGRNSRFLIHLGLEQIREVFTLIEGRPELDLYAPPELDEEPSHRGYR